MISERTQKIIDTMTDGAMPLTLSDDPAKRAYGRLILSSAFAGLVEYLEAEQSADTNPIDIIVAASVLAGKLAAAVATGIKKEHLPLIASLAANIITQEVER